MCEDLQAERDPVIGGGAAEGYLDLDVDASGSGAEESAALEALGARFPKIDPLLRNTFAVTTLSAGFKPNGSPMGPLYAAMEAAVLAVHPDAAVVPYMSTGFTGSRFFRSIGIPTYGLMPLLLPRAEHGKIHGVDERIPLAGIAEMTEIVYALIKEWNK